jgi:hypothetical protein
VLAWAPPGTEGQKPPRRNIVDSLMVLGLFGLGTLSYLMPTPLAAWSLSIPAAACGVRLWWAFRDVPLKNRGILRAYMLLSAAGVLLLTLFRFTVTSR